MPEFIEITTLGHPGCEVFTKLTEAQLRNRLEPEKGIFIAESPKVIGLALERGYQPVSMLTERRCLDGCASETISRLGDIPIYIAEPELLSAMTGYKLNRGVLCAMRRPKPLSAEEICRSAHRIAVLENIVDTTNLGAIFRSAAALGIDAVLITPSCCDPLLRRAVRVSMGTILVVPWAQIGDSPEDWPEKGLSVLNGWGFSTAAMALTDDSVSIDDPALAAEDKLAIVLGTEGDGLSKSTIARCDYTVKIPMSNGVDSLNVAAAGAVAFWQLKWRGRD
ncbi:MAG: RNA methyltransferase [Oscillospiraceae bacterium]|nr:RNA methyltransferase [Oscillospiraceae bacterium]